MPPLQTQIDIARPSHWVWARLTERQQLLQAERGAWTLQRLLAPRLLVLRSRHWGLRLQALAAVQRRAPGHCRLLLRLQGEGLATRTAGLLLRPWWRQQLRQQASSLKQWCESIPWPDTPPNPEAASGPHSKDCHARD